MIRLFKTYAVLAVLVAPLVLLAWVGRPAPAGAAALLTCTNLLQNSDMEGSGGWIFGVTAMQGAYTTAQAVSPTRSALLGRISGANVNSFSSMRQSVSVPAGDQLILRAQVYTLSQPLDTNDRQEIRVLDSLGITTLRQVWSVAEHDPSWKEIQFDLSEFLLQNIVLYFNVRNDGAGGLTAMHVDDVILEVCSANGDTPTPTPTPGDTATPTPTSAVVTATPTDTPAFVTATPTPIVVTNTPTPTPVVVTNTPTPTAAFVTATPTPIVVTNTPTPTLAVVTNTPTPTAGFITATPTPIVVTNTPTPTLIVVTNTPTPTLGFVTATPTPVVFTPTPTLIPVTPTTTPTYTPVPRALEGPCKECLVNVGFEGWGGWHFGKTVLKGGYVGENVYTGDRAVVLGNRWPDRPNYRSYSSVRQRVTLPKRDVATAYLEFWHYTMSDGDPGDYQELVILDGKSGRTLDVLWRVNRDDRWWLAEQFDMTRYLGKTIIIYFNVFNNGSGGRAAMYLDQVSLRICPPGVSAEAAFAPPFIEPEEFIVGEPEPFEPEPAPEVEEPEPTPEPPTPIVLVVTDTPPPDEEPVVDITGLLVTPTPTPTPSGLWQQVRSVPPWACLALLIVLLGILYLVRRLRQARQAGGP